MGHDSCLVLFIFMHLFLLAFDCIGKSNSCMNQFSSCQMDYVHYYCHGSSQHWNHESSMFCYADDLFVVYVLQ
jgi:hypothetical protein